MELAVSAPALRYHGAKFRLAPWIIERMPPHVCYVEPFGGAAGVLLQKPRSYSEVYNDLDGDIVNFFRVLRDPEQCALLVRACELTPYARQEFELAWEPTEDAVERARRTAVRAMMGFGSAGATKGTTGFRSDVRRKYGTAQHSWLEYPPAIAAAGQRFASVMVENRPAAEVMAYYDNDDTLHFVDPPYVHTTRVWRNNGGYRHELDDEGHRALIEQLQGLRGMVLLCGYESELYSDALAGWECHQRQAAISAGRGAGVRTECLWLNRHCSSALRGMRGRLFDPQVAL